MAMKLGTESGSLVNTVMSGHVGGPVPTVGMPCTILMWSDRVGGTVVWVSASGKTIRVREETPIWASKWAGSGHLEPTTTFEPIAPIISGGRGAGLKMAGARTFRLTKHGWRAPHRGPGLHLGHRESYRDPHF